MLAADGGPQLACMFRAEGPSETALEGMVPEDAFRFMSAHAAPLADHVTCTYQRRDGEVYSESHARAMPLAAVIACYGLAFTVAAASWVTRPKPWVQRPYPLQFQRHCGAQRF